MSTLSFAAALERAELLARQALPALQHNRLACAASLVRNGQVFQADNHVWQVASTSTPDKTYAINGAGCGCDDSHYRAPKGQCKHVLEVLLSRKVVQLMQAPESLDPVAQPEGPEPALTPSVPNVPVAGIDPKYVVIIQQTPYVKYAGLLALAHQRGLQELRATWTYNDESLSLAHATAVFPFGTFEEAGDASPSSVNRKVAPHFRRCALTRAKARVLRDALGLDAVAAEELGSEDDA